jgi:hypothetical protein
LQFSEYVSASIVLLYGNAECAISNIILSLFLKESRTGITTDGRKNLVIGTGPKIPPPPVAVEALPTHEQQSIKHL